MSLLSFCDYVPSHITPHALPICSQGIPDVKPTNFTELGETQIEASRWLAVCAQDLHAQCSSTYQHHSSFPPFNTSPPSNEAVHHWGNATTIRLLLHSSVWTVTHSSLPLLPSWCGISEFAVIGMCWGAFDAHGPRLGFHRLSNTPPLTQGITCAVTHHSLTVMMWFYWCPTNLTQVSAWM